MKRFRHRVRGSIYTLLGRAVLMPGRVFVEGEVLRWGCYPDGELIAKDSSGPLGADWMTGGRARLQASAPVFPGDVLALYRGIADGREWLRPWSEFIDGRFELISLAACPAAFVVDDGGSPAFAAGEADAAAAPSLRARVAELERQRDDLHAANNLYLERARAAERELEAERRRNAFDRAVIAAALALPKEQMAA